MSAIREALGLKCPVCVDDDRVDAALAELVRMERVVEAARECRDAMRAERADLMMTNGAEFIAMLDAALAELDGQP